MTRNGGVPKLAAVALALCLFILATTSAKAALLFPGGLPHPNAVPGGSGIVSLEHDADNNPLTVNQKYGDIEYAVFTAANFGIAFPGEDTPNGGVSAGEFVYAYQVINRGDRGDISQFTAGLADVGPPIAPFHFGDGVDDNEAVIAGDQDFIAGTGQAPSLTQVIASALNAPNGSSVKFNFSGPSAARINAGEASAVLFYTSPWAPGWENASTTAGQGQSRVPGPEEGRIEPFVPEPSSLGLAMIAVFGFALRRRGK